MNRTYATALTSRPEEWQNLIAICPPGKEFFEEILDEAKTTLKWAARSQAWGS